MSAPQLAIPVNGRGIGFDWSSRSALGGLTPMGDTRQLVQFYWKSELNVPQTRLEGRPIYDKIEFITIQMPGEILQVIERPASAFDKQRWPHQYEAFQKSTQYIPEGTPVEFMMSTRPNIVSMLKTYGFHTVEDLAAATANAIQALGMGAQEWVTEAKRYLELSAKGVSYHQIEQMKQKHEQETMALQNEVMRLKEAQAQMMAAMQQHTPQYASDAVARATAQAVAPTAAMPMPAVPDPKAWNPAAEGMIDAEARKDMIRSKIQNKGKTNVS